jgi:hypothetical protein
VPFPTVSGLSLWAVIPTRLLEASDDDGPRHLVFVAVPDLAAAKDAVQALRSACVQTDGFALLLALDASAVSVDVVTTFAATCIDVGLFWVSTWGPTASASMTSSTKP